MIFDHLKRPLRDLRISVTDRCNFRCHYCMPADIFGHDYVFKKRDELLSFEEIQRLARIFVSLGVEKIRLTGGEPLLRAEVEHLVRLLSRLQGVADLAMTTNGYLLADKASTLKAAGLQRLTISLDTLHPDRLKQMAGPHAELTQVLNGIQAASEAGFRHIKINSVIQRGVNDDEILDLLAFGQEHGHIVRFIEYMDVGNLNGWRMEHVVSAKEILQRISERVEVEPKDKNYRSEVANRYRIRNTPGEFGIIASVTQPFCGDCTRARISADGGLYTCLFATHGFDLKKLLRSGAADGEIKTALTGAWQGRNDRYSEERSSNTAPAAQKKIEMYQIGG